MIEVHYSGGASNSDPALSTGGAMSAVEVASQSVSQVSAIPGVTVLSAAGCVVDDGQGALSAALYVNQGTAGVDVVFTAYGYTAGQVTAAGGNYSFVVAATTLDLYCGGAYLRVTVDPALVSGTVTTGLAITNNAGALLPEILGYPSADTYRCVFLVNTGATPVTVNAKIKAQGTGSTLALAAAAAPGTPTGTDPSGLTFSGAASMSIPGLGEHAMWLRRTSELVELEQAITDTALIELERSA